MNKLLAANFSRLFKSKLFWLEALLMAAYGAYLYSKNSRYVVTGEPLDEAFFSFVIVIGIFLAVFCSLFLGTEYSDGTIRNKLVVGHTRSAVYFSNVIVCTAAGFLMCCAYLAAASATGIPSYGFFQADIGMVLCNLLGCFVLVIAYSSIMTLLSMLNQNKAVVAVVSIIGVLAFIGIAMNLNRALQAPEFSVLLTETGSKMVRDPGYIEGTTRSIYQFFLDFLPTGQAMQLSNMSTLGLWRLPLYSLVLIILTNTAGVLAFRKKNLK